MKVAYLVNQYPRVSHTFVRREIAALERLGIQVQRFAVRAAPERLSDPLDIAEERVTTRILDVGYVGLAAATTRVSLGHPQAFARAAELATRLAARADAGGLKHAAYLAEACVLLEWLQQHEVEHLHAHFGTNSATLALLCRTLGGPPFSFTCHGPEEFDHPRALGIPEKIEHAKFVVAISHFGRSQLMRWCSAEHWPKLQVVRCGIDETWLAAATPPPADSKRLLNIGRLSEQKGQLLLIDAAEVLAKRQPFELRLVGDGELRPELERRIERAGLGDRVQLLGWADTSVLHAELEQARALVLPSFAEGLPVVLMEALARQRPVLSTFIAGIPELVDEGCGWLVPAGALTPLIDALERVLTTPASQLKILGEEGRRRVQEHHDAQRNAAQLAQLLQQ